MQIDQRKYAAALPLLERAVAIGADEKGEGHDDTGVLLPQPGDRPAADRPCPPSAGGAARPRLARRPAAPAPHARLHPRRAGRQHCLRAAREGWRCCPKRPASSLPIFPTMPGARRGSRTSAGCTCCARAGRPSRPGGAGGKHPGRCRTLAGGDDVRRAGQLRRCRRRASVPRGRGRRRAAPKATCSRPTTAARPRSPRAPAPNACATYRAAARSRG